VAGGAASSTIRLPSREGGICHARLMTRQLFQPQLCLLQCNARVGVCL
jgi:hypothetical protein